MVRRIKIAIVGSQGLPAAYGGFETLVNFLVDRLAGEFDITVFCSSKIYKERPVNYNGCKLIYIPFSPNGFQSVIYDGISLIFAHYHYDKVLILGSSGGLFMPFFGYKTKNILNIGGQDWKRSKWGGITRKIIKLCEYCAVRNSSILISDNLGIQDYIKSEYGLDSELIAYGGDQTQHVAIQEADCAKYPFLMSEYAFSVARIQADNNICMMLEAFAEHSRYPLVLVGNWSFSDFGREIRKKYVNLENIHMMDAIYDSRELNVLRSNCKVYVHGHSAGGTNPSLVEAMYLGLPVFAYASGFNEHTTFNEAMFFHSANDLKHLLTSISDEKLFQIGKRMKEIADLQYTWEKIVNQYAEILRR